ncbi:MAG: peptidylprolyl isomerase [Alphaproteobacteria bacterium]|nr:MAG: peptidylprolyl isomerase [Alphaproteobacteria bacterium]
MGLTALRMPSGADVVRVAGQIRRKGPNVNEAGAPVASEVAEISHFFGDFGVRDCGLPFPSGCGHKFLVHVFRLILERFVPEGAAYNERLSGEAVHLVSDNIQQNQEVNTVGTVVPILAVLFGVVLLAMGMFFAMNTVGAPPSSLSSPKTGSKSDFVVARVNGTVIRLSDVIMAKRELPDEFESLPQDVVFEALVEQLIDRRLLAGEAWRTGVEQSPLAQSRIRFEREKILRDLYMVELIEDQISNKSINTLYEKKYLSPDAVQEVHLNQIVVRDREDADKARSAIDGGEEFGDVARRLSVDVSAVRGGDLGYKTRDQMDETMARVAFGLDVNVVSPPVQSRFGWHLLMVSERRTKEPPPIEEVREALREELLQSVVDREVTELRKKASIKRFDLPSLSDLDSASIASQ